MTKKLTFKEINKTEVDIPETDSNMLRRLEYDEVKKKKNFTDSKKNRCQQFYRSPQITIHNFCFVLHICLIKYLKNRLHTNILTYHNHVDQ